MVGPLVSASQSATASAYLLAFADAPAEPLLVRLNAEQRALVILTLAALVLVGAFLIAIAYLGARHVRRLARKPAAHMAPSGQQQPTVAAPKLKTADDES
jgi:hypothetical protein